MKRDHRAFKRGTRHLGIAGEGDAAHELRNCTRCGSTLSAPRTRRPALARATE